jgi:pimeloyl-ACP methyl ester carboxylesterase
MLLHAFFLVLPLAQARQISLETSDGLSLSAQATVSAKSELGVILVHQLRRSSQDWTELGQRLGASGLTTIAPDLRGHGDSDKAGTELVPDDFKAMALDLQASAAWLRGKGVKQISCVGASIGANLCTRFAAEDPSIANLVLLSPGLNYKGITSGDALQRYGERPVFIIASDGDRASKRASGILEQVAKGRVRYDLLETPGHGSQMLSRSGILISRITEWLVEGYKEPDQDPLRTKALISQDDQQLKSTGKKLKIHQ